MTTTAPTAVVPPAEPKPTPPLAPRAPDYRRELELIRTEFLRRVDELADGFNEHEDRLDDHERKIDSLSEGQRELRTKMHAVQSDVYRLADAATTQALSIERQEKLLAAQGRTLATQTSAIATIAETTKATLDFLQQKVTL